ncbi:unnamed protein product [Prunus armeniaca]
MDMMILFIATFCGLGSSLTEVDNLGQIGESLGYPTKTISTFVSLVSIWNYFGRGFSGFVSDLMVKWKVPRTLMMTFMLVLSSLAYLSTAFPFPGSVYVASVIIGVSFRAQLTLLFTIISELFGLKLSFSILAAVTFFGTLSFSDFGDEDKKVLQSFESLFFHVESLLFVFHVESLSSLLSSTLGCLPHCCLFQILGIGFIVLFLLGALASLVVALGWWFHRVCSYYCVDSFQVNNNHSASCFVVVGGYGEGGFLTPPPSSDLRSQALSSGEDDRFLEIWRGWLFS